MRFLGVVPNKILHHLRVELVRLVKIVHMPRDVLLLNSSIESLHIFIHLGLTGIIEEVDNLLSFNIFSEILVKLLAVIGLYSSNIERSYFN